MVIWNILLDERCRVKLGDFGFTRELDRGSFMETFCSTTGYASSEMLQGKKYQGSGASFFTLVFLSLDVTSHLISFHNRGLCGNRSILSFNRNIAV